MTERTVQNYPVLRSKGTINEAVYRVEAETFSAAGGTVHLANITACASVYRTYPTHGEIRLGGTIYAETLGEAMLEAGILIGEDFERFRTIRHAQREDANRAERRERRKEAAARKAERAQPEH